MAEMDAFERRVAGTLLRYADDVSVAVDAAAVAHRVALEHPRRRVGVLPWRPAAIPRVAWLLLLLAALITAMVAGMLVVGSQRPPTGFVCPPGTNPDEPGPVDQARPPSGGQMAFDRALGKIVLLGWRGEFVPVETWTFDVCTNAWAAMHPASRPDVRAFGMLAYDTAARQTIWLSPAGRVWVYDLASDTWTMRAGAPKTMRAGSPTAPGALRLVYDSVAARVVALQVGSPRLMWSFDGVADVWEPVDQDQAWYPSDSSDLHFLLAYDASVDRLVGYDQGEVRLFDLRTRTWSPPGTRSPAFGYGGYYSFGGEIAYDEAAQRTVLFSDGHVIAYDAAADRWETLYWKHDYTFPNECGVRPECRFQPSMVYDPVNERLVVYGGNVHASPAGYYPSDDVLAFDTRTREWTVLLEASEAQPAP